MPSLTALTQSRMTPVNCYRFGPYGQSWTAYYPFPGNHHPDFYLVYLLVMNLWF